jgi:hypothetical protein
VGWWLASVVYVYTDAFRSLAQPIHGLIWSPTRAPLVAAGLTGLALAAAAWHMAPQHPRGDEPDYLVIAQSLWLDGDLQIENNHQRADYAAYHRGVLPPSFLQRGRDDAIYSVHAPGLPALLVPGFALAGYPGAVATLVLFAMAGAWLAWRTAWEVTRDAAASWVGVLATVGAAPFFLHGAAIFPDAPASVLALFAVWVLVRDASARGTTDVRASVEMDRSASGPYQRRTGPYQRRTGPYQRRTGPYQRTSGPYLIAAMALGVLPWLHTRYVILSLGLGFAIAAGLGRRRAWSAMAAFVTPAALLAAAWFGLFFVIYGTPDPSAPYGSYTQMALAHLRPGVPGLLFDQQFGLLATAPVLALVMVVLRPAIRQTAPRAWSVGLLVIGLSLAYTCVVGAYRMWWGGLSAPARFLVPIVLPLAPFIALAWQSLRTGASRHLAVALLVVSLAFTAMLVAVDHGRLAYNVRDGRARWAVWVSPLVDLSAALPAAHRDAPGVVVRDAVIWIGALGLAWGVWRTLERRSRLTPLASLLTIAALVPAASAATRAARDAPGLAPSASQVRYLERRAASSAPMLVSITPPPVGRTRTWFEVELDSPRRRSASDFALLRLDALPAGRYRLFSTVRATGARLGVTLGEARTSRFVAELDPSAAGSSAPFVLALPVTGLVVKGSREAAFASGRTWIQADEVWTLPTVAAATRAHPMGDAVWLLPEDGIYPEPDGAWIAGDADVTVGLPSSAPRRVALRAGAAAVVVSWSGARSGDAQLAAGETRVVTLVPSQGRLRLRTRGGFRPSQVSPDSRDQRYLSVWIAQR